MIVDSHSPHLAADTGRYPRQPLRGVGSDAGKWRPHLAARAPIAGKAAALFPAMACAAAHRVMSEHA